MNTKNWNKNEQGYKFTPPTSKLVHIQLSDSNGREYDILWNQNPYKWDWSRQPCMIIRWIEADLILKEQSNDHPNNSNRSGFTSE